MGSRRVFPGLMAVGLLGSFGLAAVGGTAGASPPALAVLGGTASPAAAHSPTVGAVDGSSAVDFSLVLNTRDPAAAQALARAVSTAGNASYHQYLTAAQWEARFSPTAASVGAASAWLRQEGFRVGSVAADRLTISASGTAAQVEQAFHTSLSEHQVQGRTLRLADTDLSVPSSLSGIVAGALGVSQTVATADDTVDAPSTAAAPSTAPAPATAASPGGGPSPSPQPPGFRVATPCASYYGQKSDSTRPAYGNGYPYPLPYAVCGYLPSQLRSAYGVADQVADGQSGQGQTVAIIDAYASPTLFSDAVQFSATEDPGHVLTQSQFSVVYPKSYDEAGLCGASGWYGEQTLDVESVHTMAPGANIVYVGASDCINGLFSVLQSTIDNHLASVVTDSWGDDAGDLLDDVSTRTAYDNEFLLAAGTGISVLFSSGDGGDEFTTVGVTSADYPPSSPWVTAVGGTTLQIGSTGKRKGELGWSTARSFLCNSVLFGEPGCSKATVNTWLPLSSDGGSGGGTSYNYTQPWYQAGVVPDSMSTVNSPIIGPQPMRVVPDIAMEADPATGELVGETQSFPDGVYYDTYRIGGTSVASPLFAGVIALADQAAGTALGFLNPDIYKLSGDTKAIYDVVPGGKQAQSRVDFANEINSSEGYLFSTRIITFEGKESYCNGAGSCATRPVAIQTAPGYDDMTGVGAPNSGFVSAIAKL